MTSLIFSRIVKFIPNLKYRLKEASMQLKPEEFLKKLFLTTLYLTIGVNVFLFLIFSKFNLAKIIIFTFPFLFILIFFYLLKLPDVAKLKKEKEIDRELVFASRYLIVELESGISLYNAFLNISKNYKSIGKYFLEIIHKVNMGTSIENAINEAIELSPSKDFRRVMWQILNSIRTGGDIAKSLYSTSEQINREQIIKVQEYCRKLNPLAMFYMIIAVILPSLGIAMLIMFSAFISLELNLTVLLFIDLLIAFLQYMFFAIIRFSRPAVEF